ncbi:hypothetical protein HK099_000950, partial [Clydaea vesicula]
EEKIDLFDSRFFTVGKTSAELLYSLDIKDVVGADTGNAANLGNLIIDLHWKKNFEKPLMFFTGEKTLNTIEDILSNNSIKFEKLKVYQTCMEKNFKINFKNHFFDSVSEKLKKGKLNDTVYYTVFFSPSGVDLVLQNFKDFKELFNSNRNNFKALSIGKTTSSKLLSEGFEVYLEATKPDPETLLLNFLNANF